MGKIASSSNSHSSCHRSTPYRVSKPYFWEAPEKCNPKIHFLMERKEWEETTCSVCMEFPHNAVLLLCSSHEKGCRPYMCGTGYRHSNCLDQFKKAYTKIGCTQHSSIVDISYSLSLPRPGWPLGRRSELLELACPLCRGQVKGWAVVESARKFLNKKKRSCMQDGCSFVGTYTELKKHVKSVHPRAKPRDINPELKEKWRTLEFDRERQDVISTISSSMPRSVVFGDYVIEMTNSDVEGDDGDGDGNANVRGRRDVRRGILYFCLQEGARLMMLPRDGAQGGGGGYDRLFGGIDGGVNISASSTGTTGRWRRAGILRAGRQHRRRRHRTRGESEFDEG